MIKKIFDWTAGSFFRTIGRLLVFVIIGFLVAKLVDFSNIKWTDLLGIEMVKADTYQNALYFNYYKDANLTQQYTALSGGIAAYDTLNKSPNANVSFTDRTWYFSSQPDIRQYAGGRISFPFELLYGQNSQLSPDTSTFYYCNSWGTLSNGGYYCSDLRSNTNTDYDVIVQEPRIVVQAIIYYLNSTTGQDGWRTCTLNDNNHAIDCPITNEMQGIKRIRTSTYVQGDSTSTYQVVLGKMVNVYTDGTAQAIQDQTQQQQQQHNETMSYFQDDNTTSSEDEATSFFDDFSITDHGGLSSILTAPLTIVSKVLDDTCTPATFTYRNKQVILPCGQYFWNQAPELRDWLSTIESGIIAYAILVALFKMIQKLESPSNSEVEVESL